MPLGSLLVPLGSLLVSLGYIWSSWENIGDLHGDFGDLGYILGSPGDALGALGVQNALKIQPLVTKQKPMNSFCFCIVFGGLGGSRLYTKGG